MGAVSCFWSIFNLSKGYIKMTIPSKDIMVDPGRWLRFLPRWTLIVGIVSLSLPFVFIGGVGQQASDSALGTVYVELFQAVRSPVMFRLGWTIDAMIWLMLGGSLVALAGILRFYAPIKATFITVCGIAQLFGAFGSFLRLDGISDIAARYTIAALDQQVVLRESYLHLWRIIDASNYIGVGLQGVGFLLAAWGVFLLRGFPRWLAIWLAVPGLLASAQFSLFLTGAPYLFELNIIGLIGGNIALNIAITLALWRPPIDLTSAVAGKYVGNEFYNRKA
jgi:hypothetical protein